MSTDTLNDEEAKLYEAVAKCLHRHMLATASSGLTVDQLKKISKMHVLMASQLFRDSLKDAGYVIVKLQ